MLRAAARQHQAKATAPRALTLRVFYHADVDVAYIYEFHNFVAVMLQIPVQVRPTCAH